MMKTLVTGGSSTVGKHLRKYLPYAFYVDSKVCDLRDARATDELFNIVKPLRVIHLAAKVGGILDNIKHPADYFTDNVLMNTNVLRSAHKHGCTRFTGVLSTCIYPDMPDTSYPLTEYDIHTGPPPETNLSYGYAKRCLAVQIDAYNKQYGTQYNYLIPCNMYSDFDVFDPVKSHYVTSLVSKIQSALKSNSVSIHLLGTGAPLRQFMYADDFAKVINECVIRDIRDSFNVACDEVLTIKEIAEVALKALDAQHLSIRWDREQPDGQYRKDVSCVTMKHHLPHITMTPLLEGIRKAFIINRT